MRAMRGCTRGKLPWSPLPRVLCALSPPPSDSPAEAQGPQPPTVSPCHGVVALGPPCQRSPLLERAGRWIWIFSALTMGETEAKEQAQGCRGRRWQRQQLCPGPVGATAR